MNENGRDTNSIPEGVAYAKIDAILAVQDYAPGILCIRTVAVSKESFDEDAFNGEEGCKTFVIDMGLRSFFKTVDAGSAPECWWPVIEWFKDVGYRLERRYRDDYPDLEHIQDWEEAIEAFWQETNEALLPKNWLEIRYRPVNGVTDVYLYEAFSEGAGQPQYLELESTKLISGPPVMPPPVTDEKEFTFDLSDEAPTLQAFHVGQGMCTLLANSEEGVLFDVGAGTPVTRGAYRNRQHADGSVFINELLSAIKSLHDLKVVISHADSDHWRLLEWDTSLLAQASKILLPNGQPVLAFKSPVVLQTKKVNGIQDAIFSFKSGARLRLLRSQPTYSDKNGECLVGIAEISGGTGLLPGDYAYSRMGTDNRNDLKISQLITNKFDAVVVPHHGDKASANSVPQPATSGVSSAFFSAGTHKVYRHPRNVSLAAHNNIGYVVIDNHTLRNIRSKQLLP